MACSGRGTALDQRPESSTEKRRQRGGSWAFWGRIIASAAHGLSGRDCPPDQGVHAVEHAGQAGERAPHAGTRSSVEQRGWHRGALAIAPRDRGNHHLRVESTPAISQAVAVMLCTGRRSGAARGTVLATSNGLLDLRPMVASRQIEDAGVRGCRALAMIAGCRRPLRPSPTMARHGVPRTRQGS